METKNLGVYLTFAMLGGGGGLLAGHLIASKVTEGQDEWETVVKPLPIDEDTSGRVRGELKTIIKREEYISPEESDTGTIRYDLVSEDKPDLKDVAVSKRRRVDILVVDDMEYSERHPNWDYVDLIYEEKDDVLIEVIDGEDNKYLTEYDEYVGSDALVSFGMNDDQDDNTVYVINELSETNYKIVRTKRSMTNVFEDAKKKSKLTKQEVEDKLHDEAFLKTDRRSA